MTIKTRIIATLVVTMLLTGCTRILENPDEPLTKREYTEAQTPQIVLHVTLFMLAWLLTVSYIDFAVEDHKTTDHAINN